MPIYATELKPFVPCPEGLHAGIVVDVVDHGVVASTQPGWPSRPVVDVRIQCDEEDEEGKRYLVVQRFSNSLHLKAALRKFIESAQGRSLTKAELKKFDLESLLGLQLQITVVHRTQESTGAVFANIGAAMPAAKGAARLTPRDYVRVVDRPVSNGGD